MLKKYIERHWTTYVAIVLIPIVFWCAVYSVLDDPKDNEKFAVLFIGEDLDVEGLQGYITDNLKEEQIKSISVDTTTIYENLYYDYLKARCYAYDLIIISESNMMEFVGRAVFEREILVATYGDMLPNAEFYYENIDGNELPFGFIIADENTNNLFSQYYSGDEKCYLFLSPQSVNLDTINGKGVKGDDFALKVLHALFSK